MRNVTIRWRLTLWYSSVLAFILLALSLTIYAVMRHQLYSPVDTGLGEELAEVVAEIDRAPNRVELVDSLHRQFAAHEGFDYQLTAEGGERVFVNPRLSERALAIPRPPSSPADDMYETVSIDGSGRWRVISRWKNDSTGTLCVQVGRSLDATDSALAQLLAVLGFSVPVAMALAIGGGYVLANRFLSPLETMTRAARRISAHRLDERIDAGACNDELGRLAGTLNSMLDRLQHSFREMQRFTADASHEFRTPLAVIQSEAEGAIARPLSEPDKRELLGSILEECQRLTWITDQLLTLCREDAGVALARREIVDVVAIASTVVETMQPVAESRQQLLRLLGATKALVNADPTRLRQVIDNLVDNALKYTQHGGEIDVAVATHGTVVELSVRDNGPGIPTEHLPRVFERFYRVDKARSRAAGGAGLGLSIVQSIVHAHGGTVTATSDHDQGACFTVTLPAIDEPPARISHDDRTAAEVPTVAGSPADRPRRVSTSPSRM